MRSWAPSWSWSIGRIAARFGGGKADHILKSARRTGHSQAVSEYEKEMEERDTICREDARWAEMHEEERDAEDVKKGLHQKARESMWPTVAPIGYQNVPLPDGKKVIVLDPVLAPVVKP